MSRCSLNIFDGSEFIEVYKTYYTIKYNKETNSCEMFDNYNELITDGKTITDKYNIFDGSNIIIDRDSFTLNGFANLSDITNFITLNYKISWVKKLLCTKDLASSQLIKYVEECKCDIVDLRYIENTCNLIVKDNFGDIYYLSVLFHDRPWSKTEPYYSNFMVAKPNFIYS